jgi:predicted CXXCH cytochrome family protein
MRSPRHSWLTPILLLFSLAAAAALAQVRPVPGAYRGRSQCLVCHTEMAHLSTHHDQTMRGPEGILTTTVDGQTVSIFDARTPGYDAYVKPYRGYFNAENVLYTMGGHGFMQRFLTRIVPAEDDPTRPSTLPKNDMVVMGVQWNQRKGKWEDFHGPTGDGTWSSMSFNTQCGSCHATGFDPKDTTRLARWVDIGITCESCHGASNELNPLDTDPKDANEVCGACHTRGTSKTDGFEFAWNGKAGGNYQPRNGLDSYIEQVAPGSEHFWPDGESKDHHQQYPDFLRSRHNEEGLRCTDCHDHHKADYPGQLRDKSISVCLSCHSNKLLNSGDRWEHSKHLDRQATCVDCHMPRTASAVDPADIRSHTFFMIEPQQTRDFGITSGCVDCHTNGPGAPKSSKDLEEFFLEIAPSFRQSNLMPVGDGAERWTGFALANLGKRAARLLFTIFDPDGKIFPDAGVANPRLVTLGAGQQIAYTADSFFGAGAAAQRGWVRLSHFSPNLKGFYLDGDVAGTELTGLTVTGSVAKTWVTPVLWPTGDNRLRLTNPAAQEVGVVLTPFSASGTQTGTAVSSSIPARGRRSYYFKSVFPDLPAGGYVAVSSDLALEGEVTALESKTLASVRLFPSGAGTDTLTIPHVIAGDGWETRLVFYNPLDRQVEIQLQMRRDGSGALPYGGVSRRRLEPHAMMNEPLSAFIPASNTRAEGYLLVKTTSSADRIQGAVAFSSVRGGAVAALGCEATGRKQMTFSHVAQGNGYWTGLALLSPAGSSAVVELRSETGELTASKTLTLSGRVVGTLGQLLPVGDVTGGYIQIRSDGEIFAFELFGNERGSILAAVAPQ